MSIEPIKQVSDTVESTFRMVLAESRNPSAMTKPAKRVSPTEVVAEMVFDAVRLMGRVYELNGMSVSIKAGQSSSTGLSRSA
jgi:hypothetical protein